jgi:hypothetical protein
MSIIMVVTAVSDEVAEGLVAEPAGFQRFMFGGDLVFESAEERADFYRSGRLPRSLQDAVPPQRVDMDKAWAAIHHVLSKWGSVLAFLQEGGREIRQLEKRGRKRGRVLARAFSAAEVAEIHRGLGDISDSAFSAAFNPEQLKAEHVYPDVWDEHGLDYVLPWFRRMKAFVEERVGRGEGILVSDA